MRAGEHSALPWTRSDSDAREFIQINIILLNEISEAKRITSDQNTALFKIKQKNFPFLEKRIIITVTRQKRLTPNKNSKKPRIFFHPDIYNVLQLN
jgi:hypothetical protein